MNFPAERPLTYLITSGEADPESGRLPDIIRAAVSDGISLIQIREKHLSGRGLFELSKAAAELTRAGRTRLLINDRADIAAAAGADGVHLTTRSMPPAAVRKAFGSQFIIGVSTHSLEEVLAARDGGADFAVCGPVYATPGKGTPMGIEEFGAICRRAGDFPVFALGGIDEGNFREPVGAGAAGIAAIRSLNEPHSRQAIIKAFG